MLIFILFKNYKFMKNANKVQTQFSNKFGSILTKFKDNSTVQVGHEQLKSIFGQFTLKDIIVPFVSKMDNSEQLNQRQKKQYSKIYISLVDTYKEQILYDQYYQKLLESLNKKIIGVSQVIGHICKTLLNRIQNYDNLYPFVSIIVNIFHNHPEIAKILKQLIETIDSNVISSLQSQIMAILQQKIGSAKIKCQFLDTILSLVLCLQQKLSVQNQVSNFLLKYLRGEDWNCRKNCVDISYALLVINKEINESIHAVIKQLKYDKIKHVRDSVNNYEQLYKQIFGDEVIQKSPKQNMSIREAKVKSQYTKKISKSPIPMSHKQAQPTRDKSNSLDKSSKKQKNQNFFKNAKNSDVIRIHEENKSTMDLQKESFEDKKNTSEILAQNHHFKLEQSNYIAQPNINFEAYLKKRGSPQAKQMLKSNNFKHSAANNRQYQTNKNQKYQKNQPKFQYQTQFDIFKKKNRIGGEVENIKQEFSKSNISFGQGSFDKSQPEFSISCISNKNQGFPFEEIKHLFLEFQKRINDRLDRMEKRIQKIETERSRQSMQSSKYSNKKIPIEVLDISNFQESPRSVFYNETSNESKWQNSDCEGIESNLEEKIRVSIVNENWDEAYTIALTNNKKNIFLNLLERCVFPRDPTVQECILLQIRKFLNYMSALKWLKYYLMEKQLSYNRLQKLKEDLIRRGPTENRNYEMMKQLLLNEIEQKLKNTSIG